MQEIKDLKNLLYKTSMHDEYAFGKIFQSFSGMVYSFSYKLTRSDYLAEEIVQEVFLKVWIHRESLPRIDNFSAYLFTITKNLAFNILKHNLIEEKAKTILYGQRTDSHETEETVIYQDYQQLLNKAINHLPPQQKLVYSMCHLEGLRYKEAAQKLKISQLTVKTHMQQALRSIKTQFEGLMRVSVLLIAICL